MISPSPKASAVPAALLATLIILAGSLQIARPGYSVDEEFTEFAVRGIQAHGLPILPSGLLYDRGLAYSYASATINGRIVSLACAALSIVLTFVLVRRHATGTAALIAALLVAGSMPFWATATSARFYAPFLALALGTLITLSNRTPGTLGVLVLLSFVSRWTHELAFLFAAVPFVCWLVARGDRKQWFLATIAIVAGLVIGQAGLLALHALEPSSGETMVRRFFLWQVLNLFERPGDRQFAIPLVVMVIAILAAPQRARLWAVVSLSAAAMIVTFSVARATNAAPLSSELVAAILREGSRYPLDMFWHIARTTPIALLLALLAIAARLAGLGGAWRPAERAAHLLWIGWVLWFGVIESGITTNYLLLPVTFMLIAIAIDLDAIVRAIVRRGGTSVPPAGRSEDRPLRTVVIVLVVAGLAADQWRGEGSLTARLEAARPTIHVPELAEIREGLHPTDRVVCTDELGCLMLLGRIDRWLALDDYVRQRFVVQRGDEVTGVYTGVPAAFRPNDVFSPNPDGTLPDRVLIVDIFKEYPIGNSRSWLPRALEEDGVTVTPLLETRQLRVLQVSPQQRFAGLQP